MKFGSKIWCWNNQHARNQTQDLSSDFGTLLFGTRKVLSKFGKILFEFGEFLFGLGGLIWVLFIILHFAKLLFESSQIWSNNHSCELSRSFRWDSEEVSVCMDSEGFCTNLEMGLTRIVWIQKKKSPWNLVVFCLFDSEIIWALAALIWRPLLGVQEVFICLNLEGFCSSCEIFIWARPKLIQRALVSVRSVFICLNLEVFHSSLVRYNQRTLSWIRKFVNCKLD